MKRKTFVKQLMALGFSRNVANDMCRKAIEMELELRRDGMPTSFAWEGVLAHMCEQLADIFRRGKGITWCDEVEYKYCKWMVKRSKEMPKGRLEV